MKLYKYVTSDRIDILIDGFVRFTQPAAFNDPFEMSPFIKEIASDAEIEAILDDQHVARVNEEYMKQNREFRRAHKFESYLKGFPKDELLVEIKASAHGKALDQIRESLPVSFNQALGVLCLTTKFDNLLMWAHYANSHTGFVIEFDGDHPFFKREFLDVSSLTGIDEELTKDYGHLIKVDYQDQRPQISVSSVKSFESFLVKSREWEYEDEWRMLMPSAHADLVKDNQPFDTLLYKLPINAVTKVILGHRSSEGLYKEFVNLKASDTKKYGHVEIKKMSLDQMEFKLNLIDI
jgi:hypothetical protein